MRKRKKKTCIWFISKKKS